MLTVSSLGPEQATRGPSLYGVHGIGKTEPAAPQGRRRPAGLDRTGSLLVYRAMYQSDVREHTVYPVIIMRHGSEPRKELRVLGLLRARVRSISVVTPVKPLIQEQLRRE